MHDETIEDNKIERSNIGQAIPVPKLDYDKYRADLAEFELTPEQENELLSILWNIMCTMCDLSLDMDSVSMITDALQRSAFESETDTRKQQEE